MPQCKLWLALPRERSRRLRGRKAIPSKKDAGSWTVVNGHFDRGREFCRSKKGLGVVRDVEKLYLAGSDPGSEEAALSYT